MFVPDFTKPNPYEGATDDYLDRIRDTRAYDAAQEHGWIDEGGNVTSEPEYPFYPTGESVDRARGLVSAAATREEKGEAILDYQSQKIAVEQEEKTGMPANITYARSRGLPGWKNLEIEWRAKQLGLSKAEVDKLIEEGVKAEATGKDDPEAGISYALARLKSIKYQRDRQAATRPEYRAVTIQNFEGEDVKLTGKQVEEYVNASGKKQFDMAVKLGLIPEGSKYVAGTGDKWTYISGEAWEESERYGREVAEWSKKNTRLPDGEWIDNKELERIKEESPDIHKLLVTKGYKDAIDYIDKQRAEAEQKDMAFQRIGKYIDDDGMVDGAEYLSDNPGDTATLKTVGFNVSQIKKWQDYNKAQSELKEASLPVRIWRSLTPHEESEETYWEWLKDNFSIRKPKTIPDQAKLKAEYEAYINLPLWRRAFSSCEVAYDSKNDKYYSLAIGYAPPVTPASKAAKAVKTATKIAKKVGKSAVKTVGPDDVKMSEAEFAKFLKARAKDSKLTPDAYKVKQALGKTKADWTKFKLATQKSNKTKSYEVLEKESKSIIDPKIKEAKAKNWAKFNEKLPPERIAPDLVGLPEGEVLRHLKYLPKAKAEQVRRIIRSVKNIGIRSSDVTLKEPIKVITLADLRGDLKVLIQQWKNAMAAIKPRQGLLYTGFVVPAIIQNPSEMTELLRKMTPEQANKHLRDFKSLIDTNIKNKTLTASQAKELTAIQEKVQEQVQTQPLAKPAERQAEMPATQTITLSKPETKLKPALSTQTGIISPPRPPVKPGEGITPPKQPKIPRQPERVKRPPSDATDREKRQYIKQAGGAIAFRMGQLNKKDIWHIIVYPYRDERDYLRVMGRKPIGATMVRGKGSAYKTAKNIYGRAPSKKVTLDIGITDAELRTLSSGKGVAISFKGDPKLSTKGDIDISKGKTRLDDNGKVFPLEKVM